MSTIFNHLFDLPEQICYVQCGFCNTILLVSVPCSSLSMVVTVRCGHCTSLLSVNMMRASFVPLHLLSPLNDHVEAEEEEEEEHKQKAKINEHSPSMMTMTSSDDNEEEEEEEDIITLKHIVNKPPEKRQRAPSAYNRFIKKEIRRLKTENPTMPHKEAFSAAAKNWAQFPPIEYKEDEEGGEEEEKGSVMRMVVITS